MSRYIVLLIIIFAAGCSKYEPPAIVPSTLSQPIAADIVIDQGTGCQYIMVGFRSGIWPRVDKHGKHLCGAVP